MTGCGSVWLERRVRDAEAASSNLVTPTGHYERSLVIARLLLANADDKMLCQ